MRFSMTGPAEVVMGIRGALLVCLLGSCFANGVRLNSTRDVEQHYPNDGHNHTARDEASASASASSDNGPVPSILPPFNFRMNLPGLSSSQASAESSAGEGLLSSLLPKFSFNLNLPGSSSSSASAQSSSDPLAFPGFLGGSSGGASASASAESSSDGDGFASFPSFGASDGASAGASASVSAEGAALSGAGVVVSAGPQSSPLEPFCSCVVRGNCAGREAYTRQFDLVSRLQCGGQFERCCYPCPYPGMIDNFAHVIPCSPIETCQRYYGQAPTDVAQFGVLGPCPGMGTVRCVDYLLHTQAHTTVSQDVQVDVTAEAEPQAPPQIAVQVPVVQFIPDPIHVAPPAPILVPGIVQVPVPQIQHTFVEQQVPVAVPVPVPAPVPVFNNIEDINAHAAAGIAGQGNAAVAAHGAVAQSIGNTIASTAAYAQQQSPVAFSQVYPPSMWYRWGNTRNKFSLEDLFNPLKKLKKMFFPMLG